MTDLTERLRLIAAWRQRGGPTPQQSCPSVYKATLEAATTLETLTQEVERLRGLLIDPGDPAWEDARAVLVDELRKAEMATHADNMAAGHAVQIPSWIALNLIAHSRETLTQENARLREALEGCEGIESGPNGRGGMRVVVHFPNGGDETALFHVLNAALAARKALGGCDE